MNRPMTNQQLYAPAYASLRDFLSSLFSAPRAVEQGALNASGQNPVVTRQIEAMNPQAQAGAEMPSLPPMAAAPRRAAAPDPGYYGTDSASAQALLQDREARQGPATSIDDATRARALAWALRNAQAGGA
jgi:hypothetical protein